MKHDFQDYICRPFCSFFREGEKEELACRGALVVERLMAADVIGSRLPSKAARRPELWSEDDPVLSAAVCEKCPFRPEDCDYRSSTPPADAEPCGGYILLRILRAEGEITSDDLAEVADE